MKNCICSNQPFRLIGHDDGGTVTGMDLGILERARQRHRHVFKIGVGEPGLFLVAVGFDQAGFVGEAVEGLT